MDDTLPTEEVRNRLKIRSLSARRDFESRHSHAKLFFDNVGLDLGKIILVGFPPVGDRLVGQERLVIKDFIFHAPDRKRPVGSEVQILGAVQTALHQKAFGRFFAVLERRLAS